MPSSRMYKYLIVSETLSKQQIEGVVDDIYELSAQVWVVKSNLGTCADLCRTLKMSQEDGYNGVVVKFNEYYGLFDPALWQKLELWNGWQ